MATPPTPKNGLGRGRLPVTKILAHLERTAPEQDQADKPRHEMAGAFYGEMTF